MTKNKENDFIKQNNVKKYVNANGWRCKPGMMDILKLKVKGLIDEIYKAPAIPEEPKLEVKLTNDTKEQIKENEAQTNND